MTNPIVHPIVVNCRQSKVVSVQLQKTTYPFAGRIIKDSHSKGYFCRPLKSFFVRHVRLAVEDKTILVRANHLKHLLGCNNKQLNSLVTKSNGNLNDLLNRTFGNVENQHKRTIYAKRNRLKKPFLSGNYHSLMWKKKTGEIRLAENSGRVEGKGSSKDVIIFQGINFAKGVAYSQTISQGTPAEQRKNVREAKKEYVIGNALYKKYKSAHPSGNIPFVKYYNAIDRSKNKTFPTFGMLMEECEGNLFEYMQSKEEYCKKGEKEEYGDIFLDILRGVAFMHSQGLVHRDLKLDNILVKDDKGKIIDFGYAVKKNDHRSIRKGAGTAYYIAPEVYDSKRYKKHGTKIDCWSLGVMLYEIHFGESPFADVINEHYENSNFRTIARAMASFKVPHSDNHAIVHTITNLLQADPKKRWSAAQALRYLEQTRIENCGILKI